MKYISYIFGILLALVAIVGGMLGYLDTKTVGELLTVAAGIVGLHLSVSAAQAGQIENVLVALGAKPAITAEHESLRTAASKFITNVRKVAPALLACFFLMPLLSACASSGDGISLAPSVQTSIAAIGTFTVSDLQNADAIAVKNNDALGDQCYRGLIVFVQDEQGSVGSLAAGTVSGAFSAFEQGRVALKGATSAISQTQLTSLEQACGPLVVDVQNNTAAFLANVAALGKI